MSRILNVQFLRFLRRFIIFQERISFHFRMDYFLHLHCILVKFYAPLCAFPFQKYNRTECSKASGSSHKSLLLQMHINIEGDVSPGILTEISVYAGSLGGRRLLEGGGHDTLIFGWPKEQLNANTHLENALFSFLFFFSTHTPSLLTIPATWEGPWGVPEECVCLRE